MSDKLATLLWSGAANSLCGIALGDDFDRLQLPDWWKDEHSNGNVRSGWFTVSEHGVEHAICRVTQVFGRVSRVDVSLELANAAAEQPTFDDLVKRWQERLGITGEKQGRKSVGWRNIAGAYASDVEVRLASFDSDEEGTISRVEVVLGLAVGINIKASVSSLFVDIDGVADVLSSNAFPREVVKDFCGSFFAYANYWAVPNDDRERMFAIQRAVAAERPDRLRALARQLLSLATFADLKYGESLQAHYLLVGVFHFSVNNSSTGKKPPPRWTKTNLRDICALLAHLDVSASERTAWAQTILRATEDGDVDAANAVKTALGNKRGASTWLVLDSDELIEARCFDLLCGGCADDEARFLLPLGTPMYRSSLARAAVAFFVHFRGLQAPAVKMTVSSESEQRALDYARWLVFGKQHHPACSHRAVAEVFEECKSMRLGFRKLLDVVCDQTTAGATTKWILGDDVVTHSGKPDGGRYTLKSRAGSTKPAKKR